LQTGRKEKFAGIHNLKCGKIEIENITSLFLTIPGRYFRE
jgi:hypothetical protein